jgi:hypothetical protein
MRFFEKDFIDDELKPITKTWSDSLAELGNAQPKPGSKYSGLALTLIDAMDTLVVLGDYEEFGRSVK